jgi:hypothetical protein
VRTLVYQHTPELRDAYLKAIARAEYVRATLGSAQKIITSAGAL